MTVLGEDLCGLLLPIAVGFGRYLEVLALLVGSDHDLLLHFADSGMGCVHIGRGHGLQGHGSTPP